MAEDNVNLPELTTEESKIAETVAEDTYTLLFNSSDYFEAGIAALTRENTAHAARSDSFDPAAAVKVLLAEKPTEYLLIMGNIIPYVQLTELLAVYANIRVLVYDRAELADFFTDGAFINERISPVPLEYYLTVLPIRQTLFGANMFVKLMCYKFKDFETNLSESAREYANNKVACDFIRGVASVSGSMKEYMEIVRKIAFSIKGADLEQELTFRGKLTEEVQLQLKNIVSIARLQAANKFTMRYGGETKNAMAFYSWDFAAEVKANVEKYLAERKEVVTEEQDKTHYVFCYCESPQKEGFGYIVWCAGMGTTTEENNKMLTHFGAKNVAESTGWFSRRGISKLLNYMQ